MNINNLRHLIKECVREVLIEGMDVFVGGFNYTRKLNDLDGIANHLLDIVLSPLMKNLPEDQLAYFKKNGVPFYDTITPDGSYYQQGGGGSTGIINVYISGFTTTILQKLLKGIFSELRKMGVKWGTIKKENSGVYKSQVIRIPVVKNMNDPDDRPPEIHLSNANAYHIFHNVLQYDGENGFSINAEELKQRIESLNHDKGWVDKLQRPTTTHKFKPPESGEEWKEEPEDEIPSDEENPHDALVNQIGKGLGGTVISMGLSSDDIWTRLQVIYKIATWAIDHGFSKIEVS